MVVNREAIGTEARSAAVEELMGSITAHTVADTGQVPRSATMPEHLALDEAMRGYSAGDLSPEGTIGYYRRLRPYVTDNPLGIRDEDVATFLLLKPGVLVLADNQIDTLQGRPPRLDVKYGWGQPQDPMLGWGEGSNLAAAFDVQPGKEGGNVFYDREISMHGLATRLAVGEHGISNYIYNHFPTTLQPTDLKGQTPFLGEEGYGAWNDARLLRSIVSSEVTDFHSDSLPTLTGSVADNTNLVMGVQRNGLRKAGVRLDDRRWENYLKIADFITAMQIGNPAAYNTMLNTIARAPYNNGTARHIDERIRLVALSQLSAERRDSVFDLRDLHIGEVHPVYTDLENRKPKRFRAAIVPRKSKSA